MCITQSEDNFNTSTKCIILHSHVMPGDHLKNMCCDGNFEWIKLIEVQNSDYHAKKNYAPFKMPYTSHAEGDSTTHCHHMYVCVFKQLLFSPNYQQSHYFEQINIISSVRIRILNDRKR